jgi:hypothetical protein
MSGDIVNNVGVVQSGLQAWIDTNIKPNVVEVLNVKEVYVNNNARSYDVSVLVTVNADGATNIATQPVFAVDENLATEKFYFGRNKVQNFVAPANEVNKEALIATTLNALKQQDPNAKFVGLEVDTNNGITIYKIQVNGVNKAYTILDGSLTELEII